MSVLPTIQPKLQWKYGQAIQGFSCRAHWAVAPAVASRAERGSDESKGFCASRMRQCDRDGGSQATPRLGAPVSASAISVAVTALDDGAQGTEGECGRGGLHLANRAHDG